MFYSLIWRIEAALLIFALSIFPNGIQFFVGYNNNIACNEAVVRSIEKRDVTALERMMCRNIRDKEENLRDKIQLVYDSIEGNIKKVEWDRFYSGGYGAYEEESVFITVTTSKAEYYINVDWIIQNTAAPRTKGIYEFVLRKPGAAPGEYLVEIIGTGNPIKF